MESTFNLDEGEREAMRVLRAIAGALMAAVVTLLAGASGWKAWLMTEQTATAVVASASGMRWWLPPLYLSAAALMVPLVLVELWYVSSAVRGHSSALLRRPHFADARMLAAVGLYVFALLNALQTVVTWRLDLDALHGYYMFEAGMSVSVSLLIGSWVNWLSVAQPPRRRWPIVMWLASCALATQAAAERITGPRDDLAALDVERLGIVAALAAFGALAKTLHEQIDPTRPRAPVVRPLLIRGALAAVMGAAWYVLAAILQDRGVITFSPLEVALGAFSLGASYSYVIGWLAATRDGAAARLQRWIVGRMPDAPEPPPPVRVEELPAPLAPVDIDVSEAQPHGLRGAGTRAPAAAADTDTMPLGPAER